LGRDAAAPVPQRPRAFLRLTITLHLCDKYIVMLQHPAKPEELFIALVDEIPPLFFRLRGLAERAHYARGISAAQRAVLRDIVEHGPLTAPGLAAMRTVTRQAVQPVIDELFAEGLVEAQDNPRHKRSCLIVATKQGVKTHAAIRADELKALKHTAREFSLAELTSALDAIRHVSKVLRQHFPEDPA
jgi:DNA-binding MarR family transcriptional regulator